MSTKVPRLVAQLAGLLVILVLVLGCGLPGLVPAPNAPSSGLVGTLVVQTAGAVLTQTAGVSTPTSAPTVTPQPTSTVGILPTVTLTPFLGAASGDLECSLLSQSLRNGVHLSPREHFDMGWKVRNTGRVTWEPDTVYFAYLGGTKMDLNDMYRLPQSVPPDGKVALSASLVAPKRDGGYTTIWALRRGDNFFCRLSLTVNVP